MSQRPTRKSENVRRANRVIQSRTFVLMLIMGVVLFVILAVKLYKLQILQHEELQAKATDQQMRSTVVTASRGTIYDHNGNVMAISATAETVFLSPLEINEAQKDKENPPKWTKEFLAKELARILDVNEASILKHMGYVDSQYEVVKRRVDEDVANQIRELINEYEIRGVYMSTDTKRYYPYSSLAAHVIGFVGNDNVGLYGLEAKYEDQLEGQTGLVVTAKAANNRDMLSEYEQYFAEKNGNDLVLTLDTSVQYYLEKNIAEMAQKYNAAEGATGVVLNAKTGAVLGMASYPTYDLNDYATVQNDKLKEAIKEKKVSLGDMQLRQWRNKTLNDTYEPGSTFKILTLSAALEEGVIDMNTTFDCPGYIRVADATIHCTATHGHETLQETAANSCNPAFITYGLRLGNEKFYKYMKEFGLMDGSGIDLDGEATGIFMDASKFSELDLACYAFGQNFNITPIALVAAQAACINGGYLHEPYVVEKIVDDNGNVVYQHDDTPVRQVISEETSAEVRECLEYVVSDGTGRNGQVAGYRIGGKTGTADKGKTGKCVVSFVCFAPADDPEVIMLITMDTPDESIAAASGGGMVAPYCGKVMSEILPYLGIEPTYTAEELLGTDTSVPNVVKLTVKEARQKLKDRGLECRVVGDGDKVTDQTPLGGAFIPGKSTVVLYAGGKRPDSKCVVPDLVGRTPSEANTIIANAGLLLRFSGTTDSNSGSIRVISQSEKAGSKVEPGTVITVQLSDSSVQD